MNATSPQIRLPGTIFVSQDGAIYAISGSSVRRLPLPAGGDWSQPRVLPDGSLLVVRRFDEYSDLYHVSAAGKVLSQMTDNDQSSSNKTLQLDHWILWPAIGPDGASVYFATDAPKPAPRQSYEVDFSLWSAPLSGAVAIGDQGVTGGTRWSVPDAYTGGDIEPVPLPDGNVLYSSYANTGKGTVVTVLGVQTGPRSPMVSLTTPAQDCGAPAVAADGVTVAMVCDLGQTADLEVATLNGTTLSAPRVSRRQLPLQLAVVVAERRQPPVHERVRPGREFRALVHRQRGQRASRRRQAGHRCERRSRCDVRRGVDGPAERGVASWRAASGRRRSRRRRAWR